MAQDSLYISKTKEAMVSLKPYKPICIHVALHIGLGVRSTRLIQIILNPGDRYAHRTGALLRANGGLQSRGQGFGFGCQNQRPDPVALLYSGGDSRLSTSGDRSRGRYKTTHLRSATPRASVPTTWSRSNARPRTGSARPSCHFTIPYIAGTGSRRWASTNS